MMLDKLVSLFEIHCANDSALIQALSESDREMNRCINPAKHSRLSARRYAIRAELNRRGYVLAQ